MSWCSWARCPGWTAWKEDEQPKLMRRLHTHLADGSEWLAHDHGGGAAIFWL